MIKTTADAAASVGKALLLLALPLYLAVDAARYTVSQSYRETRASQQNALCFDLFDEETRVGDPVAEAARQEALPLSLVGKLDLFLQCATITEIGLAGIKLQQAEQNRLAELTEAHANGVEALEANTRMLVEQAYEAGFATAMDARAGITYEEFGQDGPRTNDTGGILWQDLIQHGFDSDFSAGDFAVGPPRPPIIQQGSGNIIQDDGDSAVPGISLSEDQRAAFDAALSAAAANAIQSFDPATVVRPAAP